MAQRSASEVAKLRMISLGLQLGDHYQRKHDGVLGEPADRAWVGEQDAGVEHVGAAWRGRALRRGRWPRGTAWIARSWPVVPLTCDLGELAAALSCVLVAFVPVARAAAEVATQSPMDAIAPPLRLASWTPRPGCLAQRCRKDRDRPATGRAPALRSSRLRTQARSSRILEGLPVGRLHTACQLSTVPARCH